MSTAWKDLERRICVALGGRRAGPMGAAVSDCVNVPFSVEIKRTSRLGPPILGRWVQQAKRQGKAEHRPWLLVVAGHYDARPVVVLDFLTFAQLAQEAGRIPTPLPVDVLPTTRGDTDAPEIQHNTRAERPKRGPV